MINWEKSLITPNYTIIEAAKHINDSSLQVAVIVDKDRHLLGLANDGDIRRALLNGVDMTAPITSIMTKDPTTVSSTSTRAETSELLAKKLIHCAPIVDDKNIVIGLVSSFELMEEKSFENPVVIMAGGLGERLRPLTDNCPKPMLLVGNEPILARIINNLVESGFHNIYISVNYLSEIIEEYFGDGHKFGANITYIHENKRLGTAGALSLFKSSNNLPFMVLNGDILTGIDYSELMQFHVNSNCLATMVVRDYSYTIPYGVVSGSGNLVEDILEKPTNHFSVNAGMYVFSPEILDHVTSDEYCDMPTLLKRVISKGKAVQTYLLNEYWFDIGQIKDLELARASI